MKNKYILPIIFLVLAITTKAQKTLILSTPQTGQINNFASDNVQFKPGYSFKATVNDWMRGYLDERLSAIQDKHNVTSLKDFNLNTDLEVGKTMLNSSVSPNGIANLNIPIKIPVSANSLQPEISVNYNSFANEGYMGIGWSVFILDKITLATQNQYFNYNSQGYGLDGNDIFLLNGQRLIPIQGLNSGEGTSYRTINESFKKIISKGSLYGMPTSFEIEDKNGTKFIYGSSAQYYNQSINKVYYSNNKTPVEWYLMSVTDRNNNKIKYYYDQDNKDRLIKIEYGINSNSGPLYKIEFEYIDKENYFYTAGLDFLKKEDKLLFQIKCYIGDAIFNKYKFQYQKETNYLLNEITEFGSDGKKYNSQKFKYGNKGIDNELSTINLNGNVYPTDFNGDGIADLFITYPKNMETYNVRYTDIKIYKGNPNGTFTETHRENPSSGFYQYMYTSTSGNYIGEQSQINQDFNGDGLGDFMLINNEPFTKTVVKINENGSYDGLEQKAYMKIKNISIFFNNGNGFTKELFFVNQDIACVEIGKGISLGDFNGDGAMDIYLAVNNEIAKEVNHLGSITNNFNPINQGYVILPKTGEIITAPYSVNNFAIDVDGDGKSDLYDQQNNQAAIIYDLQFNHINTNLIFKQKNTDIFNLPFRFTHNKPTFTGVFTNFYQYNYFNKIYVGDFNGDGKSDALGILNDDAKSTSLAISDGVNLKSVFTKKNIDIFGEDISKKLIKIGDFNGDGKSDIAWINTSNNSSENRTITIMYSDGINFVNKKTLNLVPNGTGKNRLWVGDYNGDGIDDFLYDNRLILMNNGSEEFLLTEALDGLGNLYSFKYENYIGRVNKLNSANFNNNFTYFKNIPKKVVVNHAISSQNRVFEDKSFLYGDYIFNSFTRKFIGITNNIVKDNIQNLTTEYYNEYNDNFNDLYLKTQKSYITSNPSLITNETTYEYKFIGLDIPNVFNNRSHLKQLELIKSANYITNQKFEEDFRYDEFGNNTVKTTKKGLINSNWDQTEIITSKYWAKATWVPNALETQEIITKNTQSAQISRIINYPEYDINGNLLKVVVDENNENTLQTIYSYNSIGKIRTSKISSINTKNSDVKEILKTFDYDNKFRFTKEYNNLNEFVEFKYDDLNRMIEKTTTNGLITKYEYDGFNNLVRTFFPNKSVSETKLIWKLNHGDETDPKNLSTIYGVLNTTTGEHQ